MEGIIGEIGEATINLEPAGMVSVHGELWKAEAVSGSIGQGQKIRVTAINNLTLYVEQLQQG
jgi:membrane-bound serine protease (ClpP class)